MEKLNVIKENIEEYYKIINDIINNYIKSKKRNYEILANIKEIIDNNDIINDIKKINNDNKYNDILGIYNKINQKEEVIIKSKNNKDLKEGNNIIKMNKTYQLIEENPIKEDNIINPFNKLKEIYGFYTEFISKLLSLKDKKIQMSSIIDINKFDYISTFIVFGNAFKKFMVRKNMIYIKNKYHLNLILNLFLKMLKNIFILKDIKNVICH